MASIILVVLALGLLFVACIDREDTPVSYKATYRALAIWFSLHIFFAEICSSFNCIDWHSLLLCWAITNLVLLLFCVFSGKFNFKTNRINIYPSIPANPASAFLIIVLVTTLITALLSIPNNWDSMTYHLSRIAHWESQDSLLHFPTHIERQVSQNPGAEIILLNWHVLAGTDRFDNLLQWIALLACVPVIISLYRNISGNNERWETVAILVLTLPMAILQSNSTQNDLICGFFLLAALISMIHYSQKFKLLDLLGATLFSGLAILTKGTAYLSLPVILIFGCFLIFKKSRARLPLFVVSVFCGILLLNAGHYKRNTDLYNNPLGPSYQLLNENHRPGTIFSNVVRNASLNFKTPFQAVNKKLEYTIRKSLSFLGLDPDDPKTTWAFSPKFSVGKYSTHEDYAGNPLHLILAIIALIMIYKRRKGINGSLLFSYAVCLILTVVVFCIALKWQVWNLRLQLPLFLFAIPVCGWLLDHITPGKVRIAILSLLIIQALPFLIFNKSRPLVGKDSIFQKSQYEQMFKNRSSIAEGYLKSTELLKKEKISCAGWISGGDDWEYPFWRILSINPSFRIIHVNVENTTGNLAKDKEFCVPQVVISISRKDTERVSVMGREYLKQDSFMPVTLYYPE